MSSLRLSGENQTLLITPLFMLSGRPKDEPRGPLHIAMRKDITVVLKALEERLLMSLFITEKGSFISLFLEGLNTKVLAQNRADF